MKKLLVIVWVLAAFPLFAQDETPSRWAVYAYAGPNFYLNNFDKFKSYVDGRNFSFGARVMWEPEHRISLGLKVGYYYIYRINFPGAGQGRVVLTAIPIQPFITMRLYKGFYGNFGMGPSIYTNKVEFNGSEVLNDSFTSLADVSVGFGYLQRRVGKVSFGGEVEYFYSAKSNENLMTISFVTRFPLGKGR